MRSPAIAELPRELIPLFDRSETWPCAACLRFGLPPAVAAFLTRHDAPPVPYVVCADCARGLTDPTQRRLVAERVERNLEPSGTPS
jgi:hypothetical protein